MQWHPLLVILLWHLSHAARTRQRMDAGGTFIRYHKRACGITAWRYDDFGEQTKSAYLGFWSTHKLQRDGVTHVPKLQANLSGADFKFQPNQDVNSTMPFTANLSASSVKFTSQLTFADLQGMISISRESGFVSLGQGPFEQTIPISPGQIQLLVKIAHRPWHHLHSNIGDYIDLKFKVKGRSLHQVIYEGEKGTHAPRFQMGHTPDSGHVDIASGIYYQGKWTRMLSGYPRPERGPEGEHLLAVRARLPSDSLIFILVIDPGRLDPDGETLAVYYSDYAQEFLDADRSSGAKHCCQGVLLTVMIVLQLCGILLL